MKRPVTRRLVALPSEPTILPHLPSCNEKAPMANHAGAFFVSDIAKSRSGCVGSIDIFKGAGRNVVFRGGRTLNGPERIGKRTAQHGLAARNSVVTSHSPHRCNRLGFALLALGKAGTGGLIEIVWARLNLHGNKVR